MKASGGIGIPFLHETNGSHGQNIGIIVCYGPSLEEVFHRSDRYFSLQALLLLADQLLSRVEFIHSRKIVCGKLDPWSFALGWHSWQNHQVFLVDFNVATRWGGTFHDDLVSMGHMASYFYSRTSSWEDYHQDIR